MLIRFVRFYRSMGVKNGGEDGDVDRSIRARKAVAGATTLPRVSSDVTPRVTRAGIASGLIQNAIQDMTTINADGM